MRNLGIFNEKQSINGYVVKNKPLKYAPATHTYETLDKNGNIVVSDTLIEIPKTKIAKTLARNYPFFKIQMEQSDKSVKSVELELSQLKMSGLFIIVGQNFKILSYVFIERYENDVQSYKNFLGHTDNYGEKTNKIGIDATLIGDMSSKSKFNNQQAQILAGHKRHNASKQFKMRQATGSDRVRAFKLHSMQF